MVSFEEICFKTRQRVAEKDVDDIARLKSAVDVVAKENKDWPTFKIPAAGVVLQEPEKAHKKVRATVDITNRIDPATGGGTGRRSVRKHVSGAIGSPGSSPPLLDHRPALLNQTTGARGCMQPPIQQARADPGTKDRKRRSDPRLRKYQRKLLFRSEPVRNTPV
jgi:hypothetical protein